MKNYLPLLLLLLPIFIKAQDVKEIPVTSTIDRVTVFLQNAQIIRRATTHLPAGETRLIFKGLSPYLDAQSIRVKSQGDFIVLAVSHEFTSELIENTSTKEQDQEKIKIIKNQIDILKDSIEYDKAALAALSEEEAFLKENKSISGKDTGYKAVDLEAINTYYSGRIRDIKIQQIKLNKTQKSREETIKNLENDLKTLLTKNYITNSQLVVMVSCKTATDASFEFSYFCGNAGWFPSYDLKAVNVEKPIELTYKATVHQGTREDWSNVKLIFSNANPLESGALPPLNPYYLSFNKNTRSDYIVMPGVGRNFPVVRGKITDSSGAPLIGANILVKGTSVGTVTDVDGTFSINMPPGATVLVISYTGFVTYEAPVTSSTLSLAMEESAMMLEEIVVVGYGTTNQKTEKRERAYTPPPATKIENQTSVEFVIDVPYTLKSDGKNRTVELAHYNIPAYYEYQAIPKLEKDAFLTAKITDWAQYNLLEGESNLFFEDTYLGKTLLDLRYLNDTLNIYLGRDKSILLQREKVTTFEKRNFTGNKRIDTRSYKIVVRNNKKQTINLILKDQVPVSTDNAIEVDADELSNGLQNKDTGEITWKLQLPPGTQRELLLRYIVKYPKDANLHIE